MWKLMKKVFLLLFLAISFFLVPQKVSAQEISMASQSARVHYDLAFPGILPDSPIYKLKVLREIIEEMLINEPSKKIEFYLLQADKGILSSAILIDKNEIKLAQETLLKGENNFTLLTGQFGKITSRPSPEFFRKLETASLKHQEVIISLMDRISKQDKKVFEDVLSFSKRNFNTVEKFKNKKFYN
jgi:hypothetical protein